LSLSINGPKILYVIPILGGITITETTVTSWVAMILIIALAIFLTRNLSVNHPSKRQIIAEKLVSMLYDLVEGTMGKHNLYFAPFIGTLMLSSLFGSLLGMTNILRSSTGDISTTAAWAIMVTLIVWYYNIKNQGLLQWLKGFTEPIAVMTPMNIIGEVANPVSMAFRHFGNVVGGLVMTTLVYSALAAASNLILGWIPNSFIANIPILQVGIPAALSIYFDLFSGLVQAFIFSCLAMIYIGLANPAPADTTPTTIPEELIVDANKK